MLGSLQKILQEGRGLASSPGDGISMSEPRKKERFKNWSLLAGDVNSFLEISDRLFIHAFLLEVPGKNRHFPDIVGYPRQEVSRHPNGVVVLACGKTVPAETVKEVVVDRIQLDRQLAFLRGF